MRAAFALRKYQRKNYFKFCMLRNDCGRFGDAFSRKEVVPGNDISAKRRKKTAGQTPSVKPYGFATSLSEGSNAKKPRGAGCSSGQVNSSILRIKLYDTAWTISIAIAA